MPKFAVHGKLLAVDDAKFFKYMQDGILAAMKIAAVDFAITASEVVPVWSGMAKGSFLARAHGQKGGIPFNRTAQQFLGLSDSPGSIDITSQVREYRILNVGELRGKGCKKRVKLNPRYFGSGQAKDKNAGAYRSRYDFNVEPEKFSFSFETRVAHYTENVVKKSWPSVSFVQGELAFQRTFKTWLPKAMPRPDSFITKVDYKNLLKGKGQLPLKQARSRATVSRNLEAARQASTASIEQLIRSASISYTPKNMRADFKSRAALSEVELQVRRLKRMSKSRAIRIHG